MIRKNLIKITILSLMFFGINQYSSAKSTMMLEGEELIYEISYLGIKLGSIKMVTEKMVDFQGKKVYKNKAYIDSYAGIPFVDLHAIFESWIDPSVTFSRKFIGLTKAEKGWVTDDISFNFEKNLVILNRYMGSQNYKYREFQTNKRWNDGTSLFYFAREFVHSKRNFLVPTVMNDDTTSTQINFIGKKENVEISSINYPVKTVYFNGQANWEGLYGLSGKFEGWFSDDLARIPIKAKVKVYLGSATIELKSWKRKDWVPPKD
jgi:hypothetical protein